MANKIDYFDKLPEGCIADVVSYTTPVDACRVTAVASSFRSIADSNAVWERFLSSDHQQLISRAVNDHGDLLAFSLKELYLFLCDHPLIFDSGALSFSLDKRTGKKCFMIAASELGIAWGDNPMYWRWTSDLESRFSKVIELIEVCWFDIYGKINTSLLSPHTAYTTYLVYKPSSVLSGFKDHPIEISVGIIGEETINRTVYLDHKDGVQRTTASLPRPQDVDNRYPRTRKDGWLETELAEYYNEDGVNRELEIALKEVKHLNWKRGIIIQGLEIRPKLVT